MLNYHFQWGTTYKVAAYLFIVFAFSCEKVVTDELNVSQTTPRLVIEGGIERNEVRPKQPQRIRLTSTIPYLSKEQPSVVENATVKVDNGRKAWKLKYMGNGWYEGLDIQPEVGENFTLTIDWNGDRYQGSSIIQAAPKIDSIYYAYEQETSITDEGYFVRLDVADPAGVANFYYYRVLVNDTIFIVPDRGNNRTLILSDVFFDGQTSRRVNPNEEVRIKLGDRVTVQQLGITKGYFDYLYNLFTQTGNQGLSVVGNPPPAPIRSNILNITSPSKYPLGYFYTADVSEKSVFIQ